jgi:chromosome segregation protein
MKPRLKSLELHGYKTFAGRVLFEFPGNITAIVGPNGSGKSNISDALRWVLGEQSYALLRGKKTEDMIFLGSDQRPKAGMASATILFDNETGWLPVDYSEVAISRRAYRDGSNEYLLNKQRVRLKDIAELLAQSGLAERTYTVIGQGLVDAALSLRPEERRKFFEEAAGIGLFRARREDALNRLESTRRNLERVTDILGELEPRLKGLERQAKRVEEYDRIKADLHLLLKDWYGFHWHNSQNELLRNRELLKNQEEKVNQARARRGEIEEKVDSVRIQLQDLRGKLSSWHTESSDYHREREKIGREIAVLEERLRSFETQEISLNSDLMRNEEMATPYQEKLRALQNEKVKVNQELSDCREQLLEVQKSFSLRKSERDKLESVINQTRRKLVELETKQVQLKAHQQELQNRVESFAASRLSLFEGIEKNKGAIQSAQKKLDECTHQKSLADDLLKKFEDEYQGLNEKIMTSEEDEKKLVLELGKIETDIAKTTSQLDVVRQAEKAFSGLGEGAKSLLSAVSNGKIAGQLRAVNSLIEVPYELEVAVSAALGEQLDAIMINGGLDPETILSYLDSDESGRAMLIPSDALRAGEKLKSINHHGVIGVASELVRAESGTGKLLTFLLGQVLVVEDRRTAREILSELPVWGKAVTLKGEVFAGNGIIIAGKENRSTVLSRPGRKKIWRIKLSSAKSSVMTGRKNWNLFVKAWGSLKIRRKISR